METLALFDTKEGTNSFLEAWNPSTGNAPDALKSSYSCEIEMTALG